MYEYLRFISINNIVTPSGGRPRHRRRNNHRTDIN